MNEHDDEGMGTSLPNVIPMVEIFLFLLLVTVGNAAAQQHELQARLARVKAADSGRPQAMVFVRVGTDGSYVVQGHPAGPAGLATVEAAIGKAPQGAKVLIAPEAGTPWQHIAPVLSAAHKARLEAAVRVIEKPEGKTP